MFADTASAAAASISLTLSASSPIFQVISGPAPGYYASYTVPQSEMTGSLPSFAAANYNGWSEATGSSLGPNWRRFTWRFRVAGGAPVSAIDSAVISLGSGISSGPVAVDYVYLCNMTPSATLGICGTVWNDKDNNGLQATGEVGLGGVQVSLKGLGSDNIAYTADDPTLSGPQSTSVSGTYNFAALAAGSYYIVATPLASYPQTGGTPVNADNSVDRDKQCLAA